MISTTYTFNSKPISYEVLSNGYAIYLDGKLWIKQIEPYMPYPSMSYENGCLEQIKEICSVKEKTEIEVLKENIETMKKNIEALTSSTESLTYENKVINESIINLRMCVDDLATVVLDM